MTVTSTQFSNQVEVVIVGGGPCGLATAAQISALRDKTKIAICEKYEVYKRSHIIRIKRESLGNFPRSLHPLIEKLWENAVNPHQVYIPTSTIQEVFKSYLTDQVQFYYEEVLNVRMLREKFPNVKVIIGAAGVHCPVYAQVMCERLSITAGQLAAIQEKLGMEEAAVKRAAQLLQIQVVEGEGKIPENLPSELDVCLFKCMQATRPDVEVHQYIAELKFETRQEVRALSKWTHYCWEKTAQCFARVHIGKRREGGELMHSVTVRVFISEDSYRVMEGKATFKNPMSLTHLRSGEDLPDQVRRAFNIYMNLQASPKIKKLWGEETNPNPLDLSQITGRITANPLESAGSEKWVKEEEGVVYAEVGDGAQYFPFFTSYNYGLRGSSILADAVVNKLEFDTDLSAYTEFSRRLVAEGKAKIRSKNRLLEAAKCWVTVSNWAPWQMVRFSRQYARDVQKNMQALE